MIAAFSCFPPDPARSPAPSGDGAGLPEPGAGVPADVAFFERLRVWIQAFPPAARDQAYARRFEPLGLFATQSPYTDGDSELVAALRQGEAQGRERMEQALQHGGVPVQNGWSLTYHAFDYNLDFFEVGALDDEAWKLPDAPPLHEADVDLTQEDFTAPQPADTT